MNCFNFLDRFRFQIFEYKKYKYLNDLNIKKTKILFSQQTPNFESIFRILQFIFNMWVLFYYSVVMFTVPFAVFFIVKHVCEDTLHYNVFTSNLLSVIASVVAVNVIIFFYVYHSMKRHANNKAVKEEKQD